MRRLFVIIMIVLITFVIALPVFLWKAPFFIGHIFSTQLGVPVTLDAFYYKDDTLHMENLIIGNPRPSLFPHSLQVKTIDIVAPLHNYFYRQIVLDNIDLHHIGMNIEFYDKDHKEGNWNHILGHSGKSSSKASQAIGRSAFIKLLIINDLKLNLLLFDQKEATVLPPISSLLFKDISTEKGALSRHIANAILNHIVQAVFWKNAINMTVSLPYKISESAFKTMLNPFEKIFHRDKKTPQKE